MKQAVKTDYAAFIQHIPTGKENAVSREDLAAKTGYKTIRALQRCISDARKAGYLICSTTKGGGYYFPADREELAEFAASMEKRAKNTFVAIHNARIVLDTVPGQLRYKFTDPVPDPAPEGPEGVTDEEPQKRDI